MLYHTIPYYTILIFQLYFPTLRQRELQLPADEELQALAAEGLELLGPQANC